VCELVRAIRVRRCLWRAQHLGSQAVRACVRGRAAAIGGRGSPVVHLRRGASRAKVPPSNAPRHSARRRGRVPRQTENRRAKTGWPSAGRIPLLVLQCCLAPFVFLPMDSHDHVPPCKHRRAFWNLGWNSPCSHYTTPPPPDLATRRNKEPKGLTHHASPSLPIRLHRPTYTLPTPPLLLCLLLLLGCNAFSFAFPIATHALMHPAIRPCSTSASTRRAFA
jgi:hypothetical protein